MRRPLLSVLATAIAIILAAEAARAQTNCPPLHPPDPCETLPQIYGTMRVWTGCKRLRFDINKKEFNRSCLYCPGGNCQGCFFAALRDNAMAGWNAAHASAFPMSILGGPWIYEVDGPPYEMMARMPDHDWVIKEYPEHAAFGGFTNDRPKRKDICCGIVMEPQRATMYFQYRVGTTNIHWGIGGCSASLEVNARRTALHEMGHALSLQHGTRVSEPSVMDNWECFEWPQLADGQAIACMYNPVYSCANCEPR